MKIEPTRFADELNVKKENNEFLKGLGRVGLPLIEIRKSEAISESV